MSFQRVGSTEIFVAVGTDWPGMGIKMLSDMVPLPVMRPGERFFANLADETFGGHDPRGSGGCPVRYMRGEVGAVVTVTVVGEGVGAGTGPTGIGRGARLVMGVSRVGGAGIHAVGAPGLGGAPGLRIVGHFRGRRDEL